MLPFCCDLLVCLVSPPVCAFPAAAEEELSSRAAAAALAFLLMGLREGALGREGREGLVTGGPGVVSSRTWLHTFNNLDKKHNINSQYVGIGDTI